MRMFKFISTVFFVLFCSTSFGQTKHTELGANKILSDGSFKQKDTPYWIDNFRQLRNALYQHDKSKAKKFFDFPLANQENNIWYLIYSENEKATRELRGKIKPLSEKDFDKFFDKIFSKQLINTLLKINTEDLFRNGNSESPEFRDGSIAYKLYATYDRTSNIIDLSLTTNTPYKISETEYDIDEKSFIYRFSILENGHIKFKGLIIAG